VKRTKHVKLKPFYLGAPSDKSSTWSWKGRAGLFGSLKASAQAKFCFRVQTEY